MKKVKINKNYNDTFKLVIKMLKANEFEISEKDPSKKYIIARKHASFWSYGESIEITFKKESVDLTKIFIHSYSKGIQILDWGINEENEELIANKLKLYR